MIETFCVLLFIILTARIVEELLTVPSSLTLLLFALLISSRYPDFLGLSPETFDQLLLLILPIILLPVVLSLSLEEMRRSYRALIFLAFIAVLLSVAIAAAVTPFFLPAHGFTFPMLFALYIMLMATDAITVTSIFSRFSLPEKLKTYAEGESLFNDVTALVLFYFVALPLAGGRDVPLPGVGVILVKVVLLSTLIGAAGAGAGYLAVKILKDPVEQFIIIYLVAVVSFLAAERWHISGILAVIVSVTCLRMLIDREFKKRIEGFPASSGEGDKGFSRDLLKVIRLVPAVTRKGFRVYKKEALYISVFANAVLFISMANLVRVEKLVAYRLEIIVIFLITAATRFFIVNGMYFLFGTPFHWNALLTLSGVKGGLTIIMVHSLPQGFVHREMFEAVVMGVVLLSTFLYTFGAMTVLHVYRRRLREDRVRLESGDEDVTDLRRTLRDFVERDEETGALQKISLEDILAKESSRSMRYKVDLALIGIEFASPTRPPRPFAGERWREFLRVFGHSVRGKIRTSDYFCKAGQEKYIVVAPNTSVTGAVSLAGHIRGELPGLLRPLGNVDFHLGITEYAEGDTFDILMEKIDNALSRSRDSGAGEMFLET